MRLVGEAYGWLEDTHIDCRCWLVSQNLFLTRYAPHLFYASKADYSEPNVEEPEPKLKDVEDSKPESEVEELSIDSCRSFYRAYHGVIVFVATYNIPLILEIV